MRHLSAEFEAITNEVDISEVDQGFIRIGDWGGPEHYSIEMP